MPDTTSRTPPPDLPEDAEADRVSDGELAQGPVTQGPLSAEQDVADSVQDMTAHRFDDLPQDGPLDFDDGTDMGHPRGNTQREGGTWQAEGADSGDLKPPAEILSPRNGPSDRKHGR